MWSCFESTLIAEEVSREASVDTGVLISRGHGVRVAVTQATHPGKTTNLAISIRQSKSERFEVCLESNYIGETYGTRSRG